LEVVIKFLDLFSRQAFAEMKQFSTSYRDSTKKPKHDQMWEEEYFCAWDDLEIPYHTITKEVLDEIPNGPNSACRTSQNQRQTNNQG
jgi:hypothetical protein